MSPSFAPNNSDIGKKIGGGFKCSKSMKSVIVFIFTDCLEKYLNALNLVGRTGTLGC